MVDTSVWARLLFSGTNNWTYYKTNGQLSHQANDALDYIQADPVLAPSPDGTSYNDLELCVWESIFLQQLFFALVPFRPAMPVMSEALVNGTFSVSVPQPGVAA